MSAGASHPTADSRYVRHRQIEGLDQDALARLRVIVVGAGAIGNEVVKNLVLLGVGQSGPGAIVIHDLDRVERHNLTRSVLLRESDIGLSKVASVARHAHELEPAARIEPHHGDIFDTLTLSAVAAADIVIGGVDNFDARIRINQLCLITGTPWINAAIDSRHASVDIFPFAARQRPACYECALPGSVYERLAERRSCGGLLKAALAQRVMPTTTLTTSLAAALAVSQALLLTGCDARAPHDDDPTARRLFADALRGTVTRAALAPAELCAGCGSVPWQAGLQAVVHNATDLLARLDAQAGILLSEAVIASASCSRCGDEPLQGSLLGRRAASVSDAITVCARCAQPSVAIDIRSEFSRDAFATLFADRPLPNGWIEAGGEIHPTGTPGPPDTAPSAGLPHQHTARNTA